MCCLIHDSQTDKKEFILNLKQTYETWLAEPDGAETRSNNAPRCCRRWNMTLKALPRFDGAIATRGSCGPARCEHAASSCGSARSTEPTLTTPRRNIFLNTRCGRPAVNWPTVCAPLCANPPMPPHWRIILSAGSPRRDPGGAFAGDLEPISRIKPKHCLMKSKPPWRERSRSGTLGYA